MLIRKIFSVLLGLVAFYSAITGTVLLISNIQGLRVPDGHPLDPWSLVISLLVVVPIIAGTISISLYPKENCK